MPVAESNAHRMALDIVEGKAEASWGPDWYVELAQEFLRLEGIVTDAAERVRAADLTAEERWKYIARAAYGREVHLHDILIAIAAELRAQRIARRPGGGQ
jgi:hypothetical protein